MDDKARSDYENKFANFITLCQKAKAEGTNQVIIAHPAALGDNYSEIIESLSRLAEADLSLHIVRRQ